MLNEEAMHTWGNGVYGNSVLSAQFSKKVFLSKVASLSVEVFFSLSEKNQCHKGLMKDYLFL